MCLMAGYTGRTANITERTSADHTFKLPSDKVRQVTVRVHAGRVWLHANFKSF